MCIVGGTKWVSKCISSWQIKRRSEFLLHYRLYLVLEFPLRPRKKLKYSTSRNDECSSSQKKVKYYLSRISRFSFFNQKLLANSSQLGGKIASGGGSSNVTQKQQCISIYACLGSHMCSAIARKRAR